jgi:RNA polymerase sigma factor (sigma-70 family)
MLWPDQPHGMRRGNTIMTAEASLVRHKGPVTDLATRARSGDKQAWDALVGRYAPLIWSICRRYRLGGADTSDVGQTVWLHLVDQLGNLREPAALAGWLATTTERECLRVLRAAQRPATATPVIDADKIRDAHAEIAEQELLRAERHAALREALADLTPRCQQLIALLTEDPPVPYAQISAQLGIPVGSIGPTRSRCLAKLRRHPAVAALTNAEATSGKREMAGQAAAATGPARAPAHRKQAPHARGRPARAAPSVCGDR